MAERMHIPSSPACGEWETLLADALDGLLKPEDEEKFTAHKAACPACTALYEEARKGREWLEFLSPEPEAPEGLLERILAQTGPGHTKGTGWGVGGPLPAAAGTAVPDFMPPVWQQAGFLARMRASAQPRLLMTAAMAFFSIALTLSMTGVRLTSLRWADLRPSVLRSYMERQLAEASVPIVRYYDHLRFVYEVESRVRELRNQSEGEGKGEQPEDRNPRQNQPPTPGETKRNPGQTPGRNDGGSRADPQQQPDNPALGPALAPALAPALEPGVGPSNDILEVSLTLQNETVQSGGSTMRGWKRSGRWIA